MRMYKYILMHTSIYYMEHKIKRVIIHCTDSDDSLDIGFREINDWHKQRGFISTSGINCGYHYIIRRDGRIEKGRPESEIGAHCKGKNTGSIGIVWVGRKHPTDIQMKSLKNQVRAVCSRYKLEAYFDVYGHCEFDAGKTCPNLDMVKFRAEMAFL